ncbi:hypothetical protein I3843_10G039400 [Carya illinoinensis]|uniref:Uncharacterized protein n=1 Tax=Carya illinoinensis TaxID=32201 RepID=A0A922DVX6_CARIL|nr:hypothetical protein I3760_10G039100 [Carya illinoinensis]KAG6690948.1 hypothetical protein I3842_10G039200 [Carya illinoinensis]KAG7958839.1 hypothetical protein I3843_10G039400 [Carya illinoinensis]
MAGVDHLATERSKARFDLEEMKVVWASSRTPWSSPIVFLASSPAIRSFFLLLVFFSFFAQFDSIPLDVFEMFF